jgi:hypothetical protein
LLHEGTTLALLTLKGNQFLFSRILSLALIFAFCPQFLLAPRVGLMATEGNEALEPVMD